MNNNKKGIVLSVSSALVFSLGGLLVKLIPWGTFSIISGRCVFSSLFIIAYFVFNKRKVVINGTTVIGAVLVMLNMVTYVLANKLTTAANTIILEYTAPVYIIIFSMIFLKQRPTKLKICTVAFVLLGVILVMAGSLGRGSMLGNVIAAINGVIYGLSMMNNNFKGGDSLSSTLMGHVLCAFVGLPSLIGETNFTGNVLLYVAIMGIVQAGLGYLLMALATNYTDPLTVSVVAFIEPILNPIWVLIFYKETIGILSIVGIAIVLFTIFFYNYRISDGKE